MATIKKNQIITCKNIEAAREIANNYSNGVIVIKDKNYLIVNYMTYTKLKELGYNQVR